MNGNVSSLGDRGFPKKVTTSQVENHYSKYTIFSLGKKGVIEI